MLSNGPPPTRQGLQCDETTEKWNDTHETHPITTLSNIPFIAFPLDHLAPQHRPPRSPTSRWHHGFDHHAIIPRKRHWRKKKKKLHHGRHRIHSFLPAHCGLSCRLFPLPKGTRPQPPCVLNHPHADLCLLNVGNHVHGTAQPNHPTKEGIAQGRCWWALRLFSASLCCVERCVERCVIRVILRHPKTSFALRVFLTVCPILSLSSLDIFRRFWLSRVHPPFIWHWNHTT